MISKFGKLLQQPVRVATPINRRVMHSLPQSNRFNPTFKVFSQYTLLGAALTKLYFMHQEFIHQDEDDDNDPFSISSFYEDNSKTLSGRIDLAWKIFRYTPNERVQQEAYQFLIYALNINDLGMSHEERRAMLNYLIHNKHKYIGPNGSYIPGKAPLLGFHTRCPSSEALLIDSSPEVLGAIKNSKLLDITQAASQLDQNEGILELSSQELNRFRVHIYKGLFFKDGRAFDTSTMTAHLKPNYAAFTLDLDGEFTAFNHIFGEDKIKHSSMTAGRPLFMSGEMKVEQGVLKRITTQSGHYLPTLFNVYMFLDYLVQHQVDISQTEVLIFNKPPQELNLCFQEVEVPAKHIKNRKRYSIPATAIYPEEQVNREKTAFNQLISDIKIAVNQSETKDELYRAFKQELMGFNHLLGDKLTPADLKWKIHLFKSILKRYESQYESLHRPHFSEKSQPSTNPFSLFVRQIKTIKKEQRILKETSSLELLKKC
jgi:hypothetical protein